MTKSFYKGAFSLPVTYMRMRKNKITAVKMLWKYTVCTEQSSIVVNIKYTHTKKWRNEANMRPCPFTNWKRRGEPREWFSHSPTMVLNGRHPPLSAPPPTPPPPAKVLNGSFKGSVTCDLRESVSLLAITFGFIFNWKLTQVNTKNLPYWLSLLFVTTIVTPVTTHC